MTEATVHRVGEQLVIQALVEDSSARLRYRVTLIGSEPVACTCARFHFSGKQCRHMREIDREIVSSALGRHYRAELAEGGG